MKYYGITELAKELNWSVQKAHAYYSREKFLEPVARVGSRPLWSKKQVEQMVSTWGRVTSE
jgi:hypothetical protein